MSNEEREKMDIKSLPGSLIEAISLAEQSELVLEALGEHVFSNFIKNKQVEWDDYRMRVHPYEIERFLPVL